jgi:hypothetical protein
MGVTVVRTIFRETHLHGKLLRFCVRDDIWMGLSESSSLELGKRFLGKNAI